MIENDIKVQCDRAVQMRELVLSFAKALETQMNSIETELQERVKAGFPVDVAKAYLARYYNPDKEKVDGICAVIRKKHVEERWDTVIADLKGVLGVINNNVES